MNLDRKKKKKSYLLGPIISDSNPSFPGANSLAQLSQGCGGISDGGPIGGCGTGSSASIPGASSSARFGSQPGAWGSSFGVKPEAPGSLVNCANVVSFKVNVPSTPATKIEMVAIVIFECVAPAVYVMVNLKVPFLHAQINKFILSSSFSLS